MNKWREFWLNTRLERIYKDGDASCPDDEVHTIEIGALREAEERIEKLVECSLKVRSAWFNNKYLSEEMKTACNELDFLLAEINGAKNE